MALLVLGYPKIEDSDFKWIQSIRSIYDERYFKVVNPHFTIVFPVFNIEREAFIEHVGNCIQQFESIEFILRCSMIVKDSFSNYTDIFLVPSEGFDRIVMLHDKLYANLFIPELRLDIPFIPHIGIGASTDPKLCKKVSDELNSKPISISGRVECVDVVNFENNRVETIVQYQL